jgi:hypothetical protein
LPQIFTRQLRLTPLVLAREDHARSLTATTLARSRRPRSLAHDDHARSLARRISTTCPEVAAALGSADFTTLAALLTAAADVELPAVDGKKEVIVAPTNEAFAALLAMNGVTAEEFIASPLFGPTLFTHIGAATNNGASTAPTLAGSTLRFFGGDTANLATTDKLSLVSIPPGTTTTYATVQGPMNKVPIVSTINCDGNKYVMVASDVLKPKEAGSSVAAAPAVDPAVAAAPAVDPAVAAAPDATIVPIMAEAPTMVVPPVVAAAPEAVVISVPEPPMMPAVPETPVVTPPVVPITSAASSIKVAAASAAAVVAAALM